MEHKLSNIDEENMLADCLICGSGIIIVKRYSKPQGGFRCKTKRLEENKKYYYNNQHKWKKYDKNKKKFKTSDGFVYYKTEKENWFREQNGLCAICKIYMVKPTVDHCHNTMKKRALLCTNCNTMLGHAKDNTEILKEAVRYLQRFSD